ncbi:hypothetical protein [Chitinophaga parva]|uniref:hypothetical protein n=1 Tax=Chitinophaga parva TaxID=2169414 RepID=UPI0010571B2E|nr:hypothetical protein [Chitinophaga parva]
MSIARQCLLLLLLAPLISFAQDAHYWSSEYNAGGFFAPGAVIANNRDSGVLFYNPALLAVSQRNAAAIGGNIYQVNQIRIKDGTGSGKNLVSNNASVVPQMISGSYTLKTPRALTFAYALINTPLLYYQTSQRADTKQNVLDDSYSPGNEVYVGQYTAQNNVYESGAVLSTGFKLSSRFAIGFKLEGLVHNQRYNTSYTSRALLNTGPDTLLPPIVNSEAMYNVSYYSAGARLSAGLAYEAGPHHLGLLITSPLLHVMGSGTIVSDNLLSNIQLTPGEPFNLLANTRQTGLHANYKQPFNVSAGYHYDYGKGQLAITAAWFAAMKEYNIITPHAGFFIRPDTGSNNATPDLLRLRDARRSLLNISLGLTYQLQPAVAGYVAFRTDFAYNGTQVPDNTKSGYTANISSWNLYHLQLGANLKKKQYNLRAGLLLSYGQTQHYPQPLNFDDPHEDNLLVGKSGLVKGHSITAGIMLAFIHNL